MTVRRVPLVLAVTVYEIFRRHCERVSRSPERSEGEAISLGFGFTENCWEIGQTLDLAWNTDYRNSLVHLLRASQTWASKVNRQLGVKRHMVFSYLSTSFACLFRPGNTG
jgi:hypothetical protein